MAKATDLVPVAKYAAVQMDPAELMSVISENLGQEEISEWDLERVKMPSGGGSVWEVPTLEGTDTAKELVGVMIHVKTSRGYWPEKYSGGDDPPQCSSPDGEIGFGDPGGACDACPLNAWGSAEDGEGKACKEMRQIFLLTAEDLLPMVVTLPPTSLKNARKYLLGLSSKGKRYSAVVTKIGLEKERNEVAEFSTATFTLGGVLEGDEAERVRSYADALKPSFDRVTPGAEVAEAAEAEEA